MTGCVRRSFLVYENKTSSLGHRGFHPAHLEVEIIIIIQFDLLFKITVYQEIIPTNSDF